VLLHNGGFCNSCITNGICKIREMCYKIIFFHDCSVKKDKKKINIVFLSFLYNIGFIMNGRLISTKSVL
jgi:hypothetical protein